MSAPSFIRTSALCIVLALAACKPPARAPLRVAAAADLSLAFAELGKAYEAETGQPVTFSFGSTGLLAKQIIQGAPFDVFAAANVSFADDVIKGGACAADSISLYARGRIVVWVKKNQKVPQSVKELGDAHYVRVAIANPDHAPYGRAAMQALTAAGVADTIKPKLVYGENVQQALQFAQLGNAEAAIVALSLAIVSDGAYLEIPVDLHQPIDQALVTCGKNGDAARRFTAYVNAPAGRAIMRRFGFLLPGEVIARAQ